MRGYVCLWRTRQRQVQILKSLRPFTLRYLLTDPKLPRWTLNADSRDQSLVDARDRSFQSAPCFCQFIRIWRLVLLFLPSATDWLSATQWNRTIAAVPTTRIFGSM